MARNVGLTIFRGLEANIPVLAVGELALCTDSLKVFVGTSSGNLRVNPAGSTSVKQTEIDFGSLPIGDSTFTIVDATVTATSKIVGEVAYEAPTGKDLDEVEMDSIDLKFGPGSGQFSLYARGMEGYLAGKFKINYIVG